ncbi:MAG: hypothetical protein QOF71_270 [Candidatus Eremiobacteraeota bacterium]|jgi:hypothetical protein|nr:hypothetical protein [Candidatus Eremiobacteraeota bacterium]
MLPRRAFIAGGAALACAGWSSRARAFVDTTSAGGAPRTSAEQAHTILDAVAVITATQLAVRTVWRAPGPFPPLAPIACYVARGHDPDYPDDAVIWLNVDHPELKSPRAARLTDEIPLLTELLLASADVRPRGAPSLGLENLDSIKRRSTATTLAGKVAVIAKYSPYATVSDAEFARLAFPYAVLRQMTPGIDGVARVITRASEMPREEPYAAYAGRGAVHVIAPGTFDSPAGKQALVRAFVLATADAQPGESAVKRAYQAARAEDAAHGDHWAARHAFAAPYVSQVTALLGE